MKNFESISGTFLTEPRVSYIAKQIRQLMNVVEFEKDGEVVSIDGFRLKNMEHWRVPVNSIQDMMWHLSNVCNLNCEFCYEKGNPPDFPIKNIPHCVSMDEVETRMKYWSESDNKGIFGVIAAINEPLCHPDFGKLLGILRQNTLLKPLVFVTNGTKLTEEMIKILKKNMPVFFNLSVNTIDSEYRKMVLSDRHPEIVKESIPLLEKYEIPYTASIVAWPSIPAEDIERTISYLDRFNCTMVRICLSGYSKYFSSKVLFDLEEHWKSVVDFCTPLQKKYSIPIIFEPQHYVQQEINAYVMGTIANSPATLSGIMIGDILTKVNDEPVYSPHQARSLLFETMKISRNANISIMRNGVSIEFVLDLDNPKSQCYPYNQIKEFDDFTYGIIFNNILRYSEIKQVRDAIIKNNAESKTIIMTSRLMKPIVEKQLMYSEAFDDFNIIYKVPKNNYFGGTIIMGDLLTVQDFLDCINIEIAHEHPDVKLILIPSSPFGSNRWKRDLCGVPVSELYRKSKFPIVLIDCETIQ